jgi:UDP-N-acetylglucosamine--N-acetylmuramyl-(pentapeptide) pyrophosphoryl-undecaprenol N-acetylglucosamine transferase
VSRPVVLIAGGGTGGHLMPALAIASQLRVQASDLEPVLIGAERGVEAVLLPTRDFRYYLLPAEPIYRRQWWRNVRWPVLALRLHSRLGSLLRNERPVAVLGTGGYASAPVVWAAAARSIPTAIQEQNAFPGLATRWLSRRVRHVYLGMPEARGRLRLGPRTEVFDTGNPIPPPERARRNQARARFGLTDDRPVLLVTGGSQGALAINRVVAGWLDQGGGADSIVLWTTGRGAYREFARYHRPPAVQVFDFLDPIADAYAVADLVVARAGMMTGAELCAWGLPSILIPLPTAAADHQTHNARALANAGAARLLPQSDLTIERLAATIQGLLADPRARAAMASAALARGRPAAAAEIVSRLLTLFR